DGLAPCVHDPDDEGIRCDAAYLACLFASADDLDLGVEKVGVGPQVRHADQVGAGVTRDEHTGQQRSDEAGAGTRPRRQPARARLIHDLGGEGRLDHAWLISKPCRPPRAEAERPHRRSGSWAVRETKPGRQMPEKNPLSGSLAARLAW